MPQVPSLPPEILSKLQQGSGGAMPTNPLNYLMAAADIFPNDPKPEALESTVRRLGGARFAPETYTDPMDQKFLKNLPPDIEKIDRGNTIELRIRSRAQEDLTS